MDSIELLAREDEFKKLNKQLEKKTESLIKEIEQAMQKQDIFSDFSSKLTLSPAHSTKKHNCDTHRPSTPPQTKPIKKNPLYAKNLHKTQNHTPQYAKELHETKYHNPQNPTYENGTQTIENKEHCVNNMRFCACYNDSFSENTEFLYAFVSVNVKEKVLPPSFTKDRPTVENVCKFLSSKVKLMQEQIDKLQNTLDKKGNQCEGHLTQLAELESERMSLLNKANNMRASSADAKAKCATLQAKLNEKDKQYKEQRSETDRLTVELKRVKSRSVAAEAKAASHLDTIDNLRQQLEIARKVEKEFRESSRNLYNTHQSAISRLEAQIKTLTTRIDRQMALIDNLRRQNVLLSTEGAVRGIERDYSDLLNQDL